MIAIEELIVTYPEGDFNLSIPGLQIKAGEKLALIGPSGSGKTTFLNVLAGIVPACKGMINVFDHRIDRLEEEQKRAFRIGNIGFVFQEFELIDYLTVIDNIVLPYRINPTLTLTKEAYYRAETLLEEVGILDKSNSLPQKLSQGEKQRVAICRALITRPKLILADEATGNLDPRNKDSIMKLLCDYVDKADATLLAATHDHSLLTDFNRVIDFQNFHKGTEG